VKHAVWSLECRSSPIHVSRGEFGAPDDDYSVRADNQSTKKRRAKLREPSTTRPAQRNHSSSTSRYVSPGVHSPRHLIALAPCLVRTACLTPTACLVGTACLILTTGSSRTTCLIPTTWLVPHDVSRRHGMSDPDDWLVPTACLIPTTWLVRTTCLAPTTWLTRTMRLVHTTYLTSTCLAGRSGAHRVTSRRGDGRGGSPTLAHLAFASCALRAAAPPHRRAVAPPHRTSTLAAGRAGRRGGAVLGGSRVSSV
jgi:hypothetical protein